MFGVFGLLEIIRKTAVLEIFAVLGILGVVGGFENTEELWKYVQIFVWSGREYVHIIDPFGGTGQ